MVLEDSMSRSDLFQQNETAFVHFTVSKISGAGNEQSDVQHKNTIILKHYPLPPTFRGTNYFYLNGIYLQKKSF